MLPAGVPSLWQACFSWRSQAVSRAAASWAPLASCLACCWLCQPQHAMQVGVDHHWLSLAYWTGLGPFTLHLLHPGNDTSLSSRCCKQDLVTHTHASVPIFRKPVSRWCLAGYPRHTIHPPTSTPSLSPSHPHPLTPILTLSLPSDSLHLFLTHTYPPLGTGAFVAIRAIDQSQTVLVLTGWYHWVVATTTSVPLLLGWPTPARLPTRHEAGLLVAVSAAHFVGQLLLNREFQLLSATRGSAINVLQVGS